MKTLYKNIKTIILLSFISIVGAGCSIDSDSSSSSGTSGGGNGVFKVNISSDQATITMDWQRTGKATYYSHTDLTVVDSKHYAYAVARTNNDSKVNIICTKSLETSSYVNYSCMSDNVAYSSRMTLYLDEKTNIEERGYYEETTNGQEILGYFQYRNGNLEFIKN